MSRRPWIDTGHMNADSGAVGGGTTEVKRNDALADEIERQCKVQGWVVGKTNEADPSTGLYERVLNAKAHRADIFVSIHHDWKLGEQAVIYSNTNDSREIRGRRLAGLINRRIDRVGDGIPNGGIYADRRGLAVLKAIMPAVIVEASRVQDDYTIKKMATWIVQGMCDYYGVTYKATATSTSKPKPSLPTLKQGASGSAVIKLQRALTHEGFKVTADGQFGPKTRTAVVAFQKKHHLTADGIVGPRTWKALGY